MPDVGDIIICGWTLPAQCVHGCRWFVRVHNVTHYSMALPGDCVLAYGARIRHSRAVPSSKDC
eukprot:3104380-Lingulodinium_polyedra.AAC.1